MDAKDHIGSPIDLAPIRMGRDEAEETVKAGHGGEGGGDLFAGERTGGGEDARVYTPPVVEEVAHRDLQFLDLGRGRGRANTVGTKAGKEGRDVPRVRQG